MYIQALYRIRLCILLNTFQLDKNTIFTFINVLFQNILRTPQYWTAPARDAYQPFAASPSRTYSYRIKCQTELLVQTLPSNPESNLFIYLITLALPSASSPPYHPTPSLISIRITSLYVKRAEMSASRLCLLTHNRTEFKQILLVG